MSHLLSVIAGRQLLSEWVPPARYLVPSEFPTCPQDLFHEWIVILQFRSGKTVRLDVHIAVVDGQSKKMAQRIKALLEVRLTPIDVKQAQILKQSVRVG